MSDLVGDVVQVGIGIIRRCGRVDQQPALDPADDFAGDGYGGVRYSLNDSSN